MIRHTSPETTDYNCIAWAAGESHRWWWPDGASVYYWPPGVPREETIDAFVEAYQKLGFVTCSDGTWEVGFEKVAIYALHGIPTHAARQLTDGAWTSKLGRWIDIEHGDPDEVATVPGCDAYGAAIAFLKRPTAFASTP